MTGFSNRWKRAGVLALLLAATGIPSGYAGYGFWQQFVIMNYGGGDSYYGNSLADNFDGQDFGDYALGSHLWLDGGEANTWEDSGDWVSNGRMIYRVTNTTYGTEGWTTINLGGGTLSGNDREWKTDDYGRKLSTNAPGTYYLEVYFQATAHNSDDSWQGEFYDSQTPDYKAEFTLTNLPWSTACWVTNDAGPESLTVNWTRPGSYQVMVVRRLGDWPDAPANGTAYSHGDTYGTDSRNMVVYAAGSGSSFVDRELGANTASNYYYAFYTENFSYYSVSTGVVYAGRTMQTNTPAFDANEHVDAFAYFVSDGPNGKNGGHNWSAAWAETYGSAWIESGSLQAATNYPTEYGNRLRLDPGIGWAGSKRSFTNVNSGRLYVSWLLNVDTVASDNAAQMILLEDDSEKIKIGVTGGNPLCIERASDNDKTNSSYNINSGNDYTIIARYDFAASRMDVIAYFINTEIPLTEPDSWNGSYTFDSIYITNFNKITAACGSWGTDPGMVDYDEIRIADSWGDLFDSPSYRWDNGAYPDRDWSNALNWEGDTEPDSTTNAWIDGSWTGEVTQAGERCYDLYIGTDNPGAGTIEQSGGDLVVGHDLTLGQNAGDHGTYALSDGDLVVSNNAMIGESGTGVFTVEGIDADAVIDGDMQVSDSDANNAGAVYHNAGTVTVTDIRLGRLSATEGLYRMTNGTLSVGNSIYLADGNGNATGRLVQTGGILTSADDIFVGREGRGLMQISGASTTTLSGGTSHLYIGDLSGNNNDNRVELDGGLLSVGGNVEIGDSSDTCGTLVISNGHAEIAGNLVVADPGNSTGTVEMTGGTLRADYAYIGNAGHGTFTMGGGAVTVDTVRVATWASSTGLLAMDGGTLNIIEFTDLVVGESGSGTMNIDGTAQVNVGDGAGETDIQIATAAGGYGAINQSNGTVTITAGAANSHLRIGVAGTSRGEYNLSGGSLQLDENIYMADQAGSTGLVSVAGGTLDAGLLYAGYGGYAEFTISGGASTVEEARVGLNAGSFGRLAVSAGSLDVTEAGDIIVGDNGTGIFNIDGTADVNIGDAVGETELRVGANSTGRGTVNQSNGTVTIVEDLRLGIVGGSYAAYILAGGLLDIADDVYMANNAGSTGTLTIAGGSMSADTMLMGYGGEAYWEITGGACTAAAVQVGVVDGADGTLSISGGALDVTDAADLQVGVNGSAVMNIDGTADVNIGEGTGETDFMLGVSGTGRGIVNQSNGTVTIDSGAGDSMLKVGIASGAYAEYRISGGTLDVEDHIYVGDGAGGIGTFHVIGNSASISADNDFRMYNGNCTLKVSFVSSQISTIEVGDDIQIDGNLTIDDDGALSPGTYIIATSVNASAVSGDFSATNWNGSVTGTVSYADNCIAVTIPTDQEIAVLGTNLVEIADGDATPSTADGTDYGSVEIGGSFDQHTFSITNSGEKDLTITGVTTAGTHTADFIVQSWPPLVSPLAVSNLSIRFEPQALGARSAVIHIAGDDADEADYDFAVQGNGIDAAAPYVTNSVTDADDTVTDAQMTGGVFSVTMHICDENGINTTNDAGAHFPPSFCIWNPSGVQVLTDEVFSAFTHTNGGDTVIAVDTAHVGVAGAANMLGTYTNTFSAENSNDVTTVDLDEDDDGNPLTFDVVDDDNAPPVMGHFASNFIANGGFETGDITGWGSWGSGLGVDGNAADSGDYGLWITNFNGGAGGASSALIQHRTLEPSTTYRMFCRARKVGAMDPVAVEIKVRRENSDWSASTEIATNNFVSSLSTDWQTFELEFATDASDTNYGCFVQVWNDETGSYEGRAEFDDFYVGLADDPAPMQVIMNSTRIECTNQAVLGTTNAVYTITDYQIRNTYNKYFKFAAYDTGSGLSRGTADPDTQMNITFYNPVSGGFWHPTNCSYYSASRSAADSATLYDGATNTWRIYSGYPNYEETKNMIGTNRVLVNVPDADSDRPVDQAWLTNAQFGLLEVVDDDPHPPQVTSNVFGRPLGVCIGSTWYTPQPDVDTTNAVFYINRDDLTEVDADNPFRLVISAYDADSGLYRSSTASDYTNYMHVSIGTAIVHDLYQYDSSRSTSGGTSPGTTSTWTWTSLSGREILDMVGTNVVRVSLVDGDRDWSWGDQAKDMDHIFGTIIVTNSPDQDDDITAPLLKPVTYGANLITNGGFEYGLAGWLRSGLYEMGEYAAKDGTNGLAMDQSGFGNFRFYLDTNMPVYTPVALYADFRRAPGSTTNARLALRIEFSTHLVHDWLSSDWTRVGYTNTTSYSPSYIYLYKYSPYAAGCTVYWDNVEAYPMYGVMRVWAGDEEIGSGSTDPTNGYFRVTDQHLARTSTDPLRMVFYTYDPESGLSRGTADPGTQMHISINDWLTNNCSHYYAAGSSPYADTFSSTASSVWRFTSFPAEQITHLFNAGTLYVTSSIPNADTDEGESDREWRESQRMGRIRIIDDDTANPQRTYFSAPVRTYVLMYTNNSIAANNGSTYSSTEWYPSDGFLAEISPSQPFELHFRARDTDSGLARTNSTATPSNYCRMTISHLFNENITNYDASRSDSFAQTFESGYASNVWRWTTPFSPSRIEDLYQAGSQYISVHAVDADNDRSGDYETTFYNANYIVVRDDDTSVPEFSSFVVQGAPGISTVAVYEIVGGGWSITGLVRDTNSGINVNGGITAEDNNNVSPHFIVKNSTGTVIIAGEVFSSTPGDGGGNSTAYASLGSPSVSTPVDPGEACLGIYTVQVVCADNDEDRTTDRCIITNLAATFEVVTADKVITVDGNTNDWVGLWPDTVNAATYSSGEYIWRDKEYEERNDPGAPENLDIIELRMAANDSNLYFMVRFQDINNFAHPYIAIGVDTNQDPADSAFNWIGDDANTTLGDGYYTNGNAAMHYPDRQIIVHNIDGVGQRIELYDPSGDTQWEAPSAYGGTSTTWSAANDVMEFVIPRSDLGLTGTVTGRFTVATFQNAQIWANSGDSTTNYATSDVIDSVSIAPCGGNDSNLTLSAWDEDINDGDIDYYFDVRFNGDGLVGDNAPSAPVTTFPSANSIIEKGIGPFTWTPSTDDDDEVTGYLLEISTNATFNGGENGNILGRYCVSITNTAFRSEALSGSSATQFYWRVRARDLSGVLSPLSGPYMFQTTTADQDTEGPTATLLYVGTNYTPGAAVKTELYDGELANTNNPIDVAIRLTDDAGIFLTNHPPYPSTNIISEQGRVIPNWDVMESNTLTGTTLIHGHDVCFSNFYGYNGATVATAYQYSALSITNIDLDNQYYLTVSAEDEDNNRGTTSDPQGDGDPIPVDRTVRTNYLMTFNVLDDDTNAPTVSGSFYTNRYLQDPGFEMSNTVWSPCCQSYNAAVRYGPSLADSGDHYGWLDGAGSWYETLTDTNLYPVSQTTRYVVCFRARLNNGTEDSGTARLQLMFYTNDAAMTYYHVGNEYYNVLTNLTDSYQTFVYMFQPLYEDSKVKIVFYTQSFSGNSVYWDNAALGLADDLDWSYRVQLGTEHKQAAYNAVSKDLVYAVTDGELADVSAVNPFRLHLKAYDEQSGLARDVTGLLSSQMCVSVEHLTVNNTTNLQIGECSVDSTVPACTNIWQWEHFEASTIQDMFVTGQNEISAVLYDADDDRVDDQTFTTNSYGYLLVTDDDIRPPSLFGTNELINGDFELGGTKWWFRNTGNAGVIEDSSFAHNGEKYGWTRNCETTFESSWTYVRYPATNATYMFSVWCKGTPDYSNSGANAYFKAELCDNFSAWPACVSYGREISIQDHITTNWQQFSMIITTAADIVEFRAVIGWNNRFGSETGTLYWDDLYVAQIMEPFRLAIGDTEIETSSYLGISSPSNRLYTVTDEEMATASPTTPFKFLLGMQDDSLVSRGTTDPSTQMNISVDNIFTNNVANFRSDLSTSNEGTRTIYASNVWAKTSFSDQHITDLMYTTSKITATAYDLDADRGFWDVMSVSNQQYGFITFIDDDTNYPTFLGEVMPDPGMETGTATWNPGDLSTAYGRSGIGAEVSHHQTFGVDSVYCDRFPVHNLPMEVSIDAVLVAWTDGGSVWFTIRFYDADDAEIGSSSKTITSDITSSWDTFSFRCIPPTNTASARVYGYVRSNWDNYNWVSAYFDNASVKYTSPFWIEQGGKRYVAAGTNETAITVTDGTLAAAAPAAPLRFIMLGSDEVSGLQRSTAGNVSTQCYLSIGTWVQTNIANFNETCSAADTTVGTATNVWTWNSMPQADVDTLYNTGSNDVYMTLYDTDSDRSYDRLYYSNLYCGYVTVIDDDTEYPRVPGRGNIFVNNPGFEDGTNHWLYASSAYVSVTPAAARDGSLGLSISNDASSTYYTRQYFDVAPGKDYTLSLDARKDGEVTSGVCLRMYLYTPSTAYIGQVANEYIEGDLTEDWQTFTVDFEAPTSAGFVRLELRRNTPLNSGLVYFDNVAVYPDRALSWYVGNTEIEPVDVNGTNYYYATDGQLSTVDGATPLRLSILAFDKHSGLARGTTGTAATQMNVSVGTWAISNITNYVSARSTSDSRSYYSTNLWEWDSISSDFIQDLFTAQTHAVSFSLTDNDYDRSNDALGYTNLAGGVLAVTDDDEVAPHISRVGFGGVTLDDQGPAEPLRPGDIMPVGWNSDDGHQCFILLVDVPEDTTIYIRDDEWTGLAFGNTVEGTLSWSPPPGGARAGTIVEIDNSGNASYGSGAVEDASFALGNNDQIWFYTAPDWNTAPFHFLCAFDTLYGPMIANIQNTGLIYDETALGFAYGKDNWRYKRTVTEGSVSAIRTALQDGDNWEYSDGSGDESFDFDTTPFITEYEPVDIAVIGWNSDGNDDIAFLTFRSILPGQDLYFRDDEWDGTNAFFDTLEGTLKWTAPDNGIEAGSVIVIDKTGAATAGSVTEMDAGFDVANSSDQVWIYTATDWNTAPFKIRAAFETGSGTFGGDLAGSGLAEDTNAWAWGNNDNWRYDRSLTTGTRTELWAAIRSSANWESTDGSGDQSYSLSTDGFSPLRARLALTDADIGTLLLTGYVFDAVSGVIGGTDANAPTVTIYDASGTVVDGSYLSGASDGEGTCSTAPVAFASSLLTISGAFDVAYTAVVRFVDYDQDRTLSGVNVDDRYTTERIAFTLTDDDTNRPNLFGFRFDDSLTPTDGQVADGLAITGLVQDASGIYSTTNTTYRPIFTLYSPTGAVIASSNMNDRPITPDGAATNDTAIGQDADNVYIPYADRMLGAWTCLVQVVDYDTDRIGDAETCISNFVFTVLDDDTNAPVTRTLDSADADWGSGANGKYLIVATNDTIVFDRAGTASNVIYRVTDGYLANLSDARYLEFVFGTLDSDSGISCSSAGNDTNIYMSFSIENGFTNDMSGYDATRSSPDAAGAVRTNVFTYTNDAVFTESVISNLVMSGQTNAVWVTIPDSDNDRTNDHTALYSERVGYLYAMDDDNEDALFDAFRYYGKETPTDGDMTNAAFSITGLVADASGIFGTGGADAPTYSLFSPSAQITADAAMNSKAISDGDGTSGSPAPIGIENVPVSYADNALGIWTVRVTALDYDNDGWAGDAHQVTSNMSFEVVDDDIGLPALTGLRIGTGTNGSGAAELIFSEYIEVSTGNNKYLELYNGMTSAADMDEYWVATYNNGSTSLSWSNRLSGTLSPGGCYVIAHSLASGWSGTPDDTGVIPYDGNDAIVLMHGSTTVDVLGVIGDAGTWGNEVTMVRGLDVLNPSTSWISNNWTYYSGSYSYLGSHVGPVSDGELASIGLSITGNVQDTVSGIYATGPNQPVYSIHQPDGTALATDETFTQKPAADGDARAAAEPLSDSVSGLFTYNNMALGIHTVSVTVADYDHDRAGDTLTVTNNVPMAVVDDDTNRPVTGANAPINLLRNASFETQGTAADNAYSWYWETPDKFGNIWQNFMRSDWRHRNGNWEAAIPGQWGVHTHTEGGWWQIVSNEYAAGTTWQAGGWYWNDNGTDGNFWTSAARFIAIQFLDSSTSRLYGVTNRFDAPGETWTHFRVTATASPDTCFIKWDSGAWGMGTQGALQMDDVSLGPVLGTPMTVQVGSSNVSAVGTGTNASFTVTDGDLAANRGINLLINNGFESNTLVAWTTNGAGSAENWAAETGSKGYHFRGYGAFPREGFFYQDVSGPVAGETYTFEIRGYKETNFWADIIEQKLEFLDSGYAQVHVITNCWVPAAGQDQWLTYTVSGEAPAGAAYIRTTVYYNGGSNDGSSASMLWDNTALFAGEDFDSPFQIRFGSYDEQSGLSRSATGISTTTMNITIGSWLDRDRCHYSASDSTPATNAGAVSTWRWSSLDLASVSALYNTGSNRVMANLYDNDDDRRNDRLERTGQQYGWLNVIDDDTNGPAALQLDVDWSPANATNYITDGQLRVGSYGMKITFEDASSIMTNYRIGWMPNFSVISPNGTTGLCEQGFENFNSLSNGTVIEAWRTWGGSISYTNVRTGLWQVAWSAQDYDDDRFDDRAYTSRSREFQYWTNVFTVIDDDSDAPVPPSNLTASVTYWTNINNFAFTWDPAVDSSGISLDGYRTYTNATPAIDDGTAMSGTAVTNTFTATVVNAGFEIGDGENNESVLDADTHGWWDRGSVGSDGQWDNSEALEGTNSMRVYCNAGTRPNGTPRYALIQSYIPINNSNNYPGTVTFSASFKGDLSAGAFGDFCCAFLKMEYCDAASNILATPVANEYDDGFNGRPGYGIDTDGTWSNMTVIGTNMPANTEYILASVGIGNNSTKLACEGYWDDVEIVVDRITPAGRFGATYTNAIEGSNTVWLYVVDDDQDRPGDQMMSGVTNFTIMYDATAPDQVANIVEYDGPDETSEVELRWDPCTSAGGDNLSPWRSYRIYYTEEDRDPTTNDPYFSSHNTNCYTLADMSTNSVILSNFIFGLEYRFAMAGEDCAGNIGPLSTSVVHYFAGFFMTQGVNHAQGGKVGWTAHDNLGEVDRPYDLLYVDARGFSSALTSRWARMATVTNSFLIDNSVSGIPDGQMRFYRAAQHNRWQTNRRPRIASVEIYAVQNLTLYGGQNWMTLPVVPDTNRIDFILGNDLPAGNNPADPSATRVSWYERTLSKTATNEVYLNIDGNWYYTGTGGLSGEANDQPLPLFEGFLVEMATNAAPQQVRFIGKLPTNTPAQRTQTLPADAYSFAGYHMPRWTHPSQLNLGSAGWRKSTLPFPWPGFIDTMIIWDRETQEWREIWQDADGNWRYTWPSPSFPQVPSDVFSPEAAILFNRKDATSDLIWTNALLYPLPNREMAP